MTDESILRTAAIMAVLSLVEEGSGQGNVGRKAGEAWSADHRRVAMGRSSRMHAQSARAPWR